MFFRSGVQGKLRGCTYDLGPGANELKREGVGALGSTGGCFSFVDSSLESLPSVSFDRLK